MVTFAAQMRLELTVFVWLLQSYIHYTTPLIPRQSYRKWNRYRSFSEALLLFNYLKGAHKWGLIGVPFWEHRRERRSAFPTFT